MTTHAAKLHATTALLFLALSVAMTWPLAPNLGTAVADPGDPYINAWILDWGQWATLHRPFSLFDANTFYPAKNSLAFSEHLYAVALITLPLRLVGLGPIAIYNIALLLGLALSGFGMYLLAHRLTGSWIAAFSAGIFSAFVPFRFTHLTHLQHMWGGWLPLLLLALLLYLARPSWRRAALFGALFLLNGLTNVHWLFFGAFALLATAALLAFGGFREWRKLAIATLVACVLLLPFLLPYWEVAREYGTQRDSGVIARFSARPADWLVVSGYSRIYKSFLGDESVDPERRLFPGLLCLALGLAGAVIARRRLPVSIALLWIAIGFLGSLGIHFELHRFLMEAVPGFRAIRAPARWAAIAYVGIAILVAYGVAAIPRRWAALVPALFVIELYAAPIRWYVTTGATPAVYGWLATQPSMPTLELPIDTYGSDYRFMLHATAHHQPIVNGVSGFTPPEWVRISGLANAEPIDASLVPELQRIGVGRIIIHADLLGPRTIATRDWVQRELAAGRIHFVRRFDEAIYGAWVFGFGPGVTRSAELDAFLRGQPLPGHATFGILDTPSPSTILGRDVVFAGFALSPHGVKKVELLFDNGRVRIPVPLREDAAVSRAFPWYAASTRPRFTIVFPSRPAGVRAQTDVQPVITDGRGVETRLESRWLAWP